MINILQRYIMKTMIMATLLCSLIITGVLFLMILLKELKNIGEGDYGIDQAFFYVLLRLPNELYHFSPMLILLGSIIGLSILSSHKELAVMRASGFSIRRIMLSVLSGALFLIFILSAMGETVGPSLSNKAEMRKENAQNAGQAVVTAAGVWLHVDDNFIHIEQVVGRQLLEGVTRYQFDANHQLQAAYFAKKLTLKNKQWIMHDVVKTSFYNGLTKSEAYPEAELKVKLNANLLNVNLVDPAEMSLPKLNTFSRYLTQNGLQATAYQFDFWQRLFQPIASLVMIFLALPLVLNTFSTATLGWRILAGILVGFAFFILNAVLGQLCVVYQVPTLIAAALPPLLFALIGFVLFRRLLR